MSNKILFTIIIIIGIFYPFGLFSQVFNDFGFERTQSVIVQKLNGIPYLNSWAGGINSAQFSEIDLNLDGKKDLFIYDRIGGRILTFLNLGSQGNTLYTYTDTFNNHFPHVYDWVKLADYNCDGKEDLFTYGIGGIKVYKNVSDQSTGLKFKLITNEIQSFQFSMYQGLFLSSVDYPAIADMDGDGDLDILTFWIIGTYVHYHQNMSMEKYGNCDSLDFRLNHQCWGYFKENDTANGITINAPCPFKDCAKQSGMFIDTLGTRHTGSTLLALDLNGDLAKDMIIGDVDYPNVHALYNGGTQDTARITSVDTHFPSNNVPLHLNSFPDVNSLDVNNDGIKDLIASPFDPQSSLSENKKSVWLYLNDGTNSNPVFTLNSTDFLQNDMIDLGSDALPVAFDINNDGLTDIIAGNYGTYDSSWHQTGNLHSSFTSSLSYYKNIGSLLNPVFRLIDTNFANIHALHLKGAYPAFGDIDGDGSADMILGNSDGKLIFFHNNNPSGQLPAYSAAVFNYQGIDAGDYSAPQLFDLDSDGKLDLIIGEQKGLLKYYHNDGSSSNPVFTLTNDSLGKVDVRDANVSYQGYSIPCFFKTNSGDTRLFVGSLKGGIAYYKDIVPNINGEFTEVDQYYLFLRDGERSAPAVAYYNGDTLPDLVMGTVSGGLIYFKGSSPQIIGMQEVNSNEDAKLSVYPNPGNGFFNVQLDLPFMTIGNFRVADFSGRTLKTGKICSNTKELIDLSELENGIYYIVVDGLMHCKIPYIVKKIVLCK